MEHDVEINIYNVWNTIKLLNEAFHTKYNYVPYKFN